MTVEQQSAVGTVSEMSGMRVNILEHFAFVISLAIYISALYTCFTNNRTSMVGPTSKARTQARTRVLIIGAAGRE